MGREEGHESVEKKEVNQDSETSHSQGRKGYHLKKKKKKRLPPSDCGWLGLSLYTMLLVFKPHECIVNH